MVVQWIPWLGVGAFVAGGLVGWWWADARQRRGKEALQRRIDSLTYRSDRLAGEKVVLLGKLERHGEDLAAIKQQLLVRERALFRITGTWPVTPAATSEYAPARSAPDKRTAKPA